MIDEFKKYLDETNLSENSKSAYLFALRQFIERYGSVTRAGLTQYKVWLVDNFKPQTANLRLRGMNCYLESIGKQLLSLKCLKHTDGLQTIMRTKRILKNTRFKKPKTNNWVLNLTKRCNARTAQFMK